MVSMQLQQALQGFLLQLSADGRSFSDPRTEQAGYVYVRIDNWGGELGLTHELVFGAEIHTPNPAGAHAVAISRGVQAGWYTIVEEGERFFLLEAHNRPGFTVKVWKCGYHYHRETPNSRPEKRAVVRGRGTRPL